jgi:hypothetical protein
MEPRAIGFATLDAPSHSRAVPSRQSGGSTLASNPRPGKTKTTRILIMDENGLRDVIATLVVYLKDDHDYAVTLGNELAALRDALQELSDGKFLPLLEKHRARMRGATAGLTSEIAASYDELIRRVKAGESF